MTEQPKRPSIPPVAWFAAALWAGAVVAEGASWAVWRHAAGRGPIYVASAVGWLVVYVAASRRPLFRPVIALVTAGALAGLAVSGLAAVRWHRQSTLVSLCGAREWLGTVEGDPVAGSYGATVRVRINGGPLDGARVRVGWPESAPVPDLGRTVRFSAVLEPLPAEELWTRRVARSGTCASGRAWTAEVGSWRPGPVGRLLSWRATVLDDMHDVPGAGGALLEGIVLGDRRRLIGTPTEEDFRTLGLSHLVAVSGSHLALACGAVTLLGRAIGLRRRPLVMVTVAAGAVYAIVTGMAYSALRSLLMLVVGGTAELVGRRGDGMASLAVAVVTVVAFDPWTVFDIGFQLSALAVGGLLAFGGLANAWASRAFNGRGRFVTEALALTCVAQAATVTVSASTFGMLSVMAPVANAIAGPLVSVALWLGLGGAVAGSVVAPVGVLGTRASAAVLEATARVSAPLARMPGAAVAIGAGTWLVLLMAGCALALWVRWPLPRTRRAAVGAVLAVVMGSVAIAAGPAPAQSASVIVLDVGQGDAILVRDGGRAMLVDTGADATVLRRALSRYGLRRADVLVLTHAHADHTGGCEGLSSVVDIGWVGVPRIDGSPADGLSDGVGGGSEVRGLRAGDRWMIGRTLVAVLWPPPDASAELETNDTSVVLQLRRGSFDAVLTGDAEAAAQEGMAANGLLEEVEVLKVPHHGSSNGITAAALELWSPSVGLISVGEGNDFGHPSPSTLQLLAAAHTALWRTDLVGDIAVRIDRDGYSVRSDRRAPGLALRGTIRPGPTRQADRSAVPSVTASEKGSCGRQRHRGSQARLPDLREGRAAARARPPPTSGAHSRSSRS